MPLNLPIRIRILACLLVAAAASTCPAQQHTPLPPAPAPSAAQQAVDQQEAVKLKKQAIVNGRPYVKPTHHQQFVDYLKDTYGAPALGRSVISSLYGFSRDKPTGWGQDFPGYAQRYGSSMASSAISGNVRYGMETLFHEDMTYIPCHGCSAKKKIGNAFLSEFTARHADDGHRFFTVTPFIADFSGPIIANTYWLPPGHGPLDGLVATRTVVGVRVAGHLFREFVLERRKKEVKLDQ